MTEPIIIVGAGLSGATLAERFAAAGKQVIVYEKRNHIAGNVHDYKHPSGITVSSYGAHLFHTSSKTVWDYVRRFGAWQDYEHRVISKVGDKLVPVPVNIVTVNRLFGTNIKTSGEMQQWLDDHRIPFDNPKNSEEVALSLVGKQLYEMMFKNYTKKQWDMEPAQLEPSVMARIPVRTDYNDRYFSDTYEAIPVKGYTSIVENMLANPNITVKTGVDFLALKEVPPHERIFYTGPIDAYFQNKHGKLQYRSLEFELEVLDQESYQENMVVNYPEAQYPYTRIIEFKKLYREQSSQTVIAKERSTWNGEPYYPVPTQQNRDIYAKYQSEAEKRTDVVFVGRLANYKYYNMDEAIKNALEIYERYKP